MFGIKKKSLVVNVVDQQPDTYDDRPRPTTGDRIVLAQELTKCVVGGLVAYKTVGFSFRMAEHFIAHKYPVA